MCYPGLGFYPIYNLCPSHPPKANKCPMYWLESMYLPMVLGGGTNLFIFPAVYNRWSRGSSVGGMYLWLFLVPVKGGI